MALAAFELVWIAESDDTSSPHFLERLVPYFADDLLALAYAESRVIGPDGQWLADSYRFYTDSISPQKWIAAYVEEGRAEIDLALRYGVAIIAYGWNPGADVESADEIARVRDFLLSEIGPG